MAIILVDIYSAGLAALMYLWNQDDANYQKIMIDYYANWAEAEALSWLWME